MPLSPRSRTIIGGIPGRSVVAVTLCLAAGRAGAQTAEPAPAKDPVPPTVAELAQLVAEQGRHFGPE